MTQREWKEEMRVKEATPEEWAIAALKGARLRCLKSGREFAITLGDLTTMWAAQGGKCAVSSLSLDVSLPISHFGNPLQPSLDRIDSSKGYTPDNVRFVLLAVNVALNQWGLETFLSVARAMVSENE